MQVRRENEMGDKKTKRERNMKTTPITIENANRTKKTNKATRETSSNNGRKKPHHAAAAEAPLKLPEGPHSLQSSSTLDLRRLPLLFFLPFRRPTWRRAGECARGRRAQVGGRHGGGPSGAVAARRHGSCVFARVCRLCFAANAA